MSRKGRARPRGRDASASTARAVPSLRVVIRGKRSSVDYEQQLTLNTEADFGFEGASSVYYEQQLTLNTSVCRRLLGCPL